MATRRVFVNEPLCFVRSKFGKVPDGMIVDIMLSFFDVELLQIAKKRIVEDIVELKLDSMPHVSNHLNGPNQARLEVEDILKLIRFVDERMKLDSLPLYVAENTDRIPSTKWLDGDIQSLLNKIKKLEMDNIELKMMIANMQSFVANKLSDFSVFISDNMKPIHHGLDSGFNFVREELSEIKKTVVDLNDNCPFPDPAAMDTGFSGTGNDIESRSAGPIGPNRPNHGDLHGPSDNIGCWADNATMVKVRAPPPAHPSLPAARGSRPAQGATNFRRPVDRLLSRTTLETESETDFGDGGDWQTIEGRRSAKRRRQESRQQQGQQLQRRQGDNAAPSRGQSRRSVRVIGAGVNDKIKAADHVMNKRIYAVSNISDEVSIGDIVSFLRDCDVNVVSCFQVKTKFENSKTFRVCITASDEEKFLDPKNWPANVMIRTWHFKPKNVSDEASTRNA